MAESLGLGWTSGPANHWEAGRAQWGGRGWWWGMSLQMHPGPATPSPGRSPCGRGSQAARQERGRVVLTFLPTQ